MNKLSHNLFLICKVIIGLTLLAWLLGRVNYGDLFNLFENLHVGYFLSGLFFFFLSMIFEVGKLLALIYKSENVLGTAKIIYIGSFFNNFLPSNIGGDAYKIIDLTRRHGNWFTWSVLVVADRLIGLSLLVILPGILFALYPTQLLTPLTSFIHQQLHISDFLNGGSCFVAISVIILGIVCLCRGQKKLLSLYGALRQALQNATFRQYFLALVSASLFHLSRLLGLYCLLMSLGSNTPIAEIMVAMSMAAIVSVIPISIGALGVREGAFVIGLGLYGVNPTTATAIAMLVRLILWAQAIVGGLIFLFSKQNAKENGLAST